MIEITVANAAGYLRDVGWVGGGEQVDVSALAGGVSNEVIYVAFPDGGRPDFVLKQARPRLRVAEEWLCGVERIWREVAVLRACGRLLAEPDGCLTAVTPDVVFEDRENFAIAIEAAPRAHRVWKADLLAGRVEPAIARACGELLGRLHAGSWHDPAIARELGERAIFDQLRLDPYFRAVARKRPEAAGHFARLIDETLRERHALVHADFSPKNLLVWGQAGGMGGLMMVDFETGHYGDPAFDLGFFLTHLVLKAIHRDDRRMLDLAEVFLAAYRERLVARVGEAEYARLVSRGAQCLAGCLWARVDGKSQAEYLTDEEHGQRVRELAGAIFERRPVEWGEVVEVAGV